MWIKVGLILYPPRSEEVEMQKTIIGDCRRGLRWKQVSKEIVVLDVELEGEQTSEGHF